MHNIMGKNYRLNLFSLISGLIKLQLDKIEDRAVPMVEAPNGNIIQLVESQNNVMKSAS